MAASKKTPAKKPAKKPAAKKPAKKPAAKKGGRPKGVPAPRVDAVVEALARPGGTQQGAGEAAGYARSSAGAAAARILALPGVRERVEARRAELIEQSELDSREITGTLAGQMRGFDWADIFPDEPVIQRLRAVGASGSALIRSIRFDKDTGRLASIEVADAKDAAKELARHAGMGKADAENPDDVRRDEENRRWAEEKLGEVMERFAVGREGALDICRAHAPKVVKWLM